MIKRPAWPSIFIRCDGGKDDGLGHVSRCLTLASAFRDCAVDVTFISWSPDGVGGEFITRRGFALAAAAGPAGSKADLDAVREVLRGASARPILVLDSRNIDSKYVELCAQTAKVVCLDDELKRDLPCDILVNNNIWIRETDYPDRAGRIRLIGARYNLVRPTYFLRRPAKKTARLSVLITMGGEDPFDQTSRLLTVLAKTLRECDVTVVVGPAHPAAEAVLEAAKGMIPHAEVTVAPADLTVPVRAAELALTAGGTTCYELAAAGVAQVGIILEDHQAPLVGALESAGCLVCLGRYDQLNNGDISSVVESVLASPRRLHDLGAAGSRLFDGPGAPRIVKTIERWLVAA